MDVKQLGYKIVSDLLKRRENRITTMLMEGVEEMTEGGPTYRCAAHVININNDERMEIGLRIQFKRNEKGDLEPQPFTALMGETNVECLMMPRIVNEKIVGWWAIDILDNLNVIGLGLVSDAVKDRFPGFHSGRIYKMGCRLINVGTIQFEFLGYYRKGLQTEPAPDDGIGEIVVSTRIEFRKNEQQWHPLQFPAHIANKLYEYLPMWNEESKEFQLHRMPTTGKDTIIDPSPDPSPEEEE
jgi:hypothetical protein